MKIIRSPQKLTAGLKIYRQQAKSIGFVPTMGALHQGHLTLIRRARRENAVVVVSIFVNPTQFGQGEDLQRYPRPIKKDIALLKEEKVDFLFYPEAAKIYPEGYSTYVRVDGLSDVLCGESRPGHFRGVATVVAKLLNIVGADSAYFGQKDAQQVIIIKRMVRDLNIGVKIKVSPTVREKDGLAMSSRNTYLNPQQRKEAAVLYQSLRLARDLIREGLRDSKKIIYQMRRLIQTKKSARIDYLSVVDATSLNPVVKIYSGCLVVLAVWIGKTRLIDNMVVKV